MLSRPQALSVDEAENNLTQETKLKYSILLFICKLVLLASLKGKYSFNLPGPTSRFFNIFRRLHRDYRHGTWPMFS